jgi:hypothetical protein
MTMVARRLLGFGITAAEVRRWDVSDSKRPVTGHMELACALEVVAAIPERAPR